MDIAQYQTDSLVGLRELTQARAKPAIQPVSAIAGGQTEPESQVEDGSSLFETILDTINPLQHIPGVSTAYQAVTDDKSGALAEMAGGFLFGGPVGLAAGAASSFFEMLTGKSFSEHAMAFFGGEGDVAQDPLSPALAAVQTPDAPSLATLVTPTTTPLALEQYQAFAAAQSEQHQGIGATANDVSWATHLWTDNALKQATGLYEANQSLGEQKNKPVQSMG